MIFKVRWMHGTGWPHVYCRLFVGERVGHFVTIGSLTMNRKEFDAFRESFDADFEQQETGEGRANG